ncbi:aquaporin [uncultured Methylovirgula sp.]|uniref:MIP/aquaporin family protein n=1 Tax=uncultured Methylovirgula sp. TaxID=1285960 RepID=UPI0026352A32|nr:aquaporin [uncultured Methylovirgula sp.]
MSQMLPAKLLAEFIGTFTLVFIGAGAGALIGGAGPAGLVGVALAHGLVVFVFASAYGPISGGHVNPAVTVGVLAAGAMRLGEAAAYIAAQLVGGIIGAELLRFVLGGAATGLGVPTLAKGIAIGSTLITVTPAAGFVLEALLAFFLVTVVLSTAVAGRTGHLAPLAIGMTLVLNILMGGPLTGAAFNPARALGPMVATGTFSHAWLYACAPIAGAVFAALVHAGLGKLTRGPAMERAHVSAAAVQTTA